MFLIMGGKGLILLFLGDDQSSERLQRNDMVIVSRVPCWLSTPRSERTVGYPLHDGSDWIV